MNPRIPPGAKQTTAAAALVFALLAACDDGPTRPSPPATPPGPAPVTVVRLKIRGPDTIPPGESAQYSAVAHQSDGSSRDVTREAEWHSAQQEVLTVSPSGLATGHARGAAVLNASVGPAYSTKEVLVLPANTYRLTGTVKEEGFYVNGARVEVTAGTGRGLAATTIGGEYVLWGVAGDVEIRVNRVAYQEQTKRILVTTHQTLDFDLIPSTPRVNVAGTYRLTVTADAACRAALPEEARSRTYTAIATQTGPRLTITLEGGSFYRSSAGRVRNAFGGLLDSDGITFVISPAIGYYYYYYSVPAVLDVLSASMIFQFSGTARTTIAPGNLSGTLSGRLETVRSTGDDSFETVSLCASNRHEFVLSR